MFRSKKANNILRDEDSKNVYISEHENNVVANLWAPEMHKAPNGLWYIYTSCTTCQTDKAFGGNHEKRLLILESNSQDPFDGFHYKSHPAPDMFAIDPTVYTAKDGKQYICYSYCTDKQELEIRELINPWTFGEKRAIIATPEYEWELEPCDGTWLINEGAFFIESGEKLYIAYSYNGCYNDNYGMALLEYVGGDLCEKSSWVKQKEPFFTKGNGLYGPGHATFFRSPDKTELWIAYHCLNESRTDQKPRARYMNIQKIEVEKDGTLKKAIPVGWGVENAPPSGERE